MIEINNYPTIEDNNFRVRMICDSLSPHGIRLSTIEATFPRLILAEFNTHRFFSRNSASSRAIPVEKQLKRIFENPYFPIHWGQNQKGMQADNEIESATQAIAIEIWGQALKAALEAAQKLSKLGVHKQITNRLLEPFMYHTVLVTSTEWNNFFALRCHKDAQPEIHKIALMMRELYDKCEPKYLNYKHWHLPLLQPNEFICDWLSESEIQKIKENNLEAYFFSIEDAKKISAGRCARTSYLTHDGKRDPLADIQLCEKLHKSGHCSPLEHVARPMTEEEITLYRTKQKEKTDEIPFLGNFRGWFQFRKEMPHEDDFSKILELNID